MDIALAFSGCHRRGGVERSVWELARHLSRRHSVTVYANEIDTRGLDGVNFVSLGPQRGSALRLVYFHRSLRRALLGSCHDHIISFGVGGADADVLWVNSVHRAWLRESRRSSRDRRARRLSVLRYMLPRHQVLLAMERRYFRRGQPQSIVVVADAAGCDLRRIYGVRADKISVIHNGFSPEEFSPERRSDRRSEARREFGFSDDDLVVLMAANELDRKGFNVLLDAQALADEEGLQVLLVGRAAPSAAHWDKIRRYGTAERFKYAGTESDMGRVHAAADLFVLPTLYEAFSLAIIEALASGLPVVTSNVPGAADRIIDDVNGRLLTNAGSPAELATVLREAADADRRAAWGKNAPRAVEDLTWEAISKQAERLIEGLPSITDSKLSG